MLALRIITLSLLVLSIILQFYILFYEPKVDFVKEMLKKTFHNDKFALYVLENFVPEQIFPDNTEIDMITEQEKCDFIHNLILSKKGRLGLYIIHLYKKGTKRVYNFWQPDYQLYAYGLLKKVKKSS